MDYHPLFCLIESKDISLLQQYKSILPEPEWKNDVLHRSTVTSLLLCCQYGNLEIFKWLWNESSDVSLLKHGEYNRNALFYCCLNTDASIGLSILKYIKTLLSENQLKNMLSHRDDGIATVHMRCCQYGSLEMFKWLWNERPHVFSLQNQAYQLNSLFYCFLNADASIGFSILKYIKSSLSDSQWKSLLSHRDGDFSTVYMFCCKYGNLEMFKWLWNELPDGSLLEKGKSSQNALFYCLENPDKSIGISLLKYIKTLLSDTKWKNMLSHRDNDKHTVQIRCCRYGSFEMFTWLWNEQSDVSLLLNPDYGTSALYYCIDTDGTCTSNVFFRHISHLVTQKDFVEYCKLIHLADYFSQISQLFLTEPFEKFGFIDLLIETDKFFPLLKNITVDRFDCFTDIYEHLISNYNQHIEEFQCLIFFSVLNKFPSSYFNYFNKSSVAKQTLLPKFLYFLQSKDQLPNSEISTETTTSTT